MYATLNKDYYYYCYCYCYYYYYYYYYYYMQIIQRYDIILIQEIRDSRETAIYKLQEKVNE